MHPASELPPTRTRVEGSAKWTVEECWTLAAESKPIGLVSAPRRGKQKTFILAAAAKDLLESDVAAAEVNARKFLERAPGDPDALFLLGAALRRTGRHAEARAILLPLTASQPQMGRAWHELGEALAGCGETGMAMDALLRAVDFDCMNKGAWYALGDLLTFPANGGEHRAIADPQLLEACAALRERRFEFAERILRGRFCDRPSDAQAMKLLADVSLQTGRWAEFESLLEECLSFDGDFAGARFRYATMLFSYRHFARSLPHIEELLRSDPANLLYRTLRALVRSRQPAVRTAAFEDIIGDCDHRPGIWLLYARMLTATRNPEAVAAHKKAIRMLPSFADAYLSLANIKSFHIDDDLIASLRALLARPHLPAEDRAKLHYVLGKASEDMGRYAEAFDNYRTSNEILQGAGASGIERSSNYLRQAKTFFTPAFFRRRADVGCRESGPIFIVGMPRSGTTLVEQILSCHSAVEALGELTILEEIGKRFAPDRPDRQQGYPNLLADLDYQRFRLIGEEYIKATRSRRRRDKPFFTDKLPGNFSHIGLIQLALPNAKIVDLRRHPLACCFSNYKHYFPAGAPQTLDQRDIARLYVGYVEVMAHFDEVLPGKIHRLIYENLIDNCEAEVRRLLEYLGLPFEEQCLRFHENRRIVLTLSADQVGVPLYRTGVDHWRHFEHWLGPMKEELGHVLEIYPEVPEFYPGVHVRSQNMLRLGEAGRQFNFVKGLRRAPFGDAGRTKEWARR